MAMVDLSSRELTLIRVALLQRLDRLKARTDMAESYEETRTLLNGKLWIARADADIERQTMEESNGPETE